MASKNVKELAKVLAGIKDPSLAEDFLNNILTPSELEDVSMRLQIFKSLFNGMPQRKIAKTLGVSLGTIAHGSREMKYGKKGIHKVLSKDW